MPSPEAIQNLARYNIATAVYIASGLQSERKFNALWHRANEGEFDRHEAYPQAQRDAERFFGLTGVRHGGDAPYSEGTPPGPVLRVVS